MKLSNKEAYNILFDSEFASKILHEILLPPFEFDFYNESLSDNNDMSDGFDDLWQCGYA